MKSKEDVAISEVATSRLRVVWEYIWTLGLMALIVFGARSSLADWYEVPSGSMLPTIQLGDRIFVNKLAYDLRVPFSGSYIPFTNFRIPYMKLATLGEPKRGDIVVFVYPEDNRTDYVKRLVGLPGDRVEVRDNVLYVNGLEMARRTLKLEDLPPGAAQDPTIDESTVLYMENLDGIEHFVFEKAGDNFPSADGRCQYAIERGCNVVPPNYYFMMGDNRDNSSDSRTWGFVPAENLRGRALRVVLSFEPVEPGSSRLQSLLAFFNPARLRWSRFLLPLTS